MANFSDPAYREGYNHGSLSSSGSIVDLFTDLPDTWRIFQRAVQRTVPYAYLLGVLIFSIVAFGKVAGVALFAAPFLFRKYLWRGSRKVWYYLGLFGVAFLVLSAHGGTLVAPGHTAQQPVAHSVAR
jgi:hypothetical protein